MRKIALVLSIAVGCSEPTGVDEARRHLGERAGLRTAVYDLPLSVDTVRMRELFSSNRVDSTGALLTLTADPETLRVGIGSRLAFDNIAFDNFAYDFSEILTTSQTSVSTGTLTVAPPAGGPQAGPSIARAPGDTTRFTTPNGSQVASATISGGYVVVTIQSTLNASGDVTVGVRDAGGTVVSVGPIRVAASSGSPVVAVDSADLAGKTVTQLATLSVSVAPAGGIGPIPTGTISANAVFRPLTLSAVSLSTVNESFSRSYTVFTGEPRLTAVDTVEVATGSFSLTLRNKLPIALAFDVRLSGATSTTGGVIGGVLTVPAAPGDGTQRSGTLTLSLTGATLRPSAMGAIVTGTATGTDAVITPTNTTGAAQVSGSGSVTVGRLAGRLDPATTPELRIAVEESQEIEKAGLDFGDLEDIVEAITLNDAIATVTLTSTAGTPLVLPNASLRLVQLTAAGALARDAGGNLAYERDATGAPISVPIAAPGQSVLAVGRGSVASPATTTVALQAAPLVTRVAHLLFGAAPARVAVVATGTADAGDGAPSTLTSTDSLAVRMAMRIAMDLTIPDSGVVFTRTDSADGAKLGPKDSADAVRHLDSARVTLTVANGAPFRITVTPAFVGRDLPSGDVFGAAGAVVLAGLDLPAATVNANGTVASPTTGSVSVALTGEQAAGLLSRRVNVSVRVRLKPPTGSGGRGALRPSDRLIIMSRAWVSTTPGRSR